MPKTISIIRHKPNVVELGIAMPSSDYTSATSYALGNNEYDSTTKSVIYGQVVPIAKIPSGISAYRFEAASNFDAVWNLVTTVSFGGGKSKSAQIPGIMDGQSRGITKWVYAPSDYSNSVPAVSDLKPYYLRYFPIFKSGNVGAVSPAHLILPYSSTPNRSFSISGNVDNAGYTEIILPGLVTSASFAVEGNNSIFVKFDQYGSEYPVSGLANGMDWTSSWPAFNSIYVKGSAEVTKFYMNCRLVNCLAL